MLAPHLQKYWDWRAAGNFICGGTGTGLLVVASIMNMFGHITTWYGLTAAIFVATGLGLVGLETGRPTRSMNVFRNPGSSWMSREGFLATALLPLALLASLFDSTIVLIISAILALCFLFSQAQMLYASKGIPAWRAKEINAFILSTGLTEGIGVFLIGSTLFSDLQMENSTWQTSSIPIWIAALILMMLRSIAWLHYLGTLKKSAPSATLLKLNEINIPFIIIGLIIPLGITLHALFIDENNMTLSVFAGLCMTLAGWLCKYTIIIRAAYTQGYAITHTPARGGGHAGPGVQPGWKVQ